MFIEPFMCQELLGTFIILLPQQALESVDSVILICAEDKTEAQEG